MQNIHHFTKWCFLLRKLPKMAKSSYNLIKGLITYGMQNREK